MDAATFIATRPWVWTPIDMNDAAAPHAQQAHCDFAASAAGRRQRDLRLKLEAIGALLVTVDLTLAPVFCFVVRQISAASILGLLAIDAFCIGDAALKLFGQGSFDDDFADRARGGRASTRWKMLHVFGRDFPVDVTYLRRRLAIDILSSFPFELFDLASAGSASPFWRLCRMPRVYRIRRLVATLENNVLHQASAAIVWLLVSLLMTAHWASCCWIYLGGRDGAADGWVVRFAPGYEDDLLALYYRSSYWTLTTILTVGYGDVRPVTDKEVGFATVVVLSGNVLFAYLIGLITNYINDLNRTATLFRDRLARLRSFMECRHLSAVVQSRISDLYADRLWLATSGANERDVISALPVSMRRNISLLLYSELLINVPIFQRAEFGFIQSLADQLMPQIYPPDTDVILFGEVAREMFFCVRGRCAVLTNEGVRVFTIKDSMTFGEVGVLFSVKCTATVRTLALSHLLSLSKAGLSQSMTDYPKQAERIHELAKERAKQIGINVDS